MSWSEEGEVDLTNAAMEDSVCLVCSFVIVGAGYQLECGHVMHNECFDAFLEIPHLSCDTCANSQWFYASGQYEADWGDDYQTQHFEDSLSNDDHVLTNLGTNSDPNPANIDPLTKPTHTDTPTGPSVEDPAARTSGTVSVHGKAA